MRILDFVWLIRSRDGTLSLKRLFTSKILLLNNKSVQRLIVTHHRQKTKSVLGRKTNTHRQTLLRIHNAKADWKLQIKDKQRKIKKKIKTFLNHLNNLQENFIYLIYVLVVCVCVCIPSASVGMKFTTWAFVRWLCLFIFLVEIIITCSHISGEFCMFFLLQ